MEKNNFYVGLDIGTNSVGWAVTDEEYNIKKFKNNSMWGIHLFEEGQTAKERRDHRGSRRRRHRKIWRQALLREIFADELTKVDSDFLNRLDDSKFYPEDKKIKDTNCLFNDSDFDDKAYHKKYPTIYHLRLALMNEDAEFDIRLVYLAINHILKHRGHFIHEDDNLGEDIKLTEAIKSIRDWVKPYNIKGNATSISEAKINIYDKHKEDLKTLKEMAKNHLTKDERKKLFNSTSIENNYVHYIGGYLGKGTKAKSTCTQEEFCEYTEKLFKNKDNISNGDSDFKRRLEGRTFLPKQTTADNILIPFQLHYEELKRILGRAKEYLTFLEYSDEYGFSNIEKILAIMKFRIPYYVGPLNEHSDFSWFARLRSGKIYPWNFDEKIDKFDSAKKFINNLTNFCTYLPTEKVLPKHSILYSKFMLLNQLNILKINGKPLDHKTKVSIFEDFYIKKHTNKLTKKTLINYLKCPNKAPKSEEIELSGINEEIKGNMKSYHDLKVYIDNGGISETQAEEIIEIVTILGKSKDMLVTYLKKSYPNLSEDDFNHISKLGYTGWGRLSKKFLKDISTYNKNTGENESIISLMYKSENNLNQLLSYNFEFSKKIESENAESKTTKITYKDVDKLYLSPAIKRSVWRTLCIIKEIVKIQGCDPKKIFIEVAREEHSKGKETNSRKKQLDALYKANKEYVSSDLKNTLDNTSNQELMSKKLYLYFLQIGRCAYSGDTIDLSQLSSAYNIDHIYPQSKTMDNSIDNTVLVKANLNQDKGDKYPIDDSIINDSAKDLWKFLKDKKFMSLEKYYRLTRETVLSDDELYSFISRQLVETRQSTKVICTLLKRMYPDTTIVYVKAKYVHNFRNKNKFIKSRKVNDFHHAKDAYLNIVVGNVFDVTFASNPIKFVKDKKQKYDLTKVFDNDVKRENYPAWKATNGETLDLVRKYMSKNDIRFTRYATTYTGSFFDENPFKKGKGQYPLKTKDKRLNDISKYGAYNKPSISYFYLVEHGCDGKRKRSIEAIPVYLSTNKNADISDYLANVLNLTNPRPLLKIKKHALLSVVFKDKDSSFKLHISAKNNNSYKCKPAAQLILNDKLTEHVNYIERYIERVKKLKVKEPNKSDIVSSEKNAILYDELLQKLKSTIYKNRPCNFFKTLDNAKVSFCTLTMYEQCKLLSEILTLFSCNGKTANLTLINGAESVGTLTFSKYISNLKEIKLINESVTGLFSNVIDLKTYGGKTNGVENC